MAKKTFNKELTERFVRRSEHRILKSFGVRREYHCSKDCIDRQKCDGCDQVDLFAIDLRAEEVYGRGSSFIVNTNTAISFKIPRKRAYKYHGLDYALWENSRMKAIVQYLEEIGVNNANSAMMLGRLSEADCDDRILFLPTPVDPNELIVWVVDDDIHHIDRWKNCRHVLLTKTQPIRNHRLNYGRYGITCLVFRITYEIRTGRYQFC